MGGLVNFVSRLKKNLKKWIRAESVYPQPGFIDVPGYIRFPVLIALRIVIFISIVIRFVSLPSPQGIMVFVLWVSIFLAGLLIGLAWHITYHLSHYRARRSQFWLTITDILLITVFYWFTGKANSDIFLFYCLPFLTVVQYFGVTEMIWLVGLATFIGIFAVITVLIPSSTLEVIEIIELIVLRAIFYPGIFGFLAWRQLERRRQLGQREVELQTLLDFRNEISSIFDVKRVLERVVRKAVEVMKVSGGHAFLVDYETGKIQFRFATEDYLAQNFDMDGRLKKREAQILQDAIQQVVQDKRPYLIDNVGADSPAWGEVFDPAIQSLLWVPILARDTVVGVLGVGGSQPRQFDENKQSFFEVLAGQTTSIIERARLLKAQIQITKEMASALELSHEMDSLLQELADRLGFDHATVSLVDKYLQTIESVRGVNVPSGWISRASYALDKPDIMTDIIRTGRTEVIVGWDERFNPELYERFGHERLARIFLPLKVDGEVVGVVEAGCLRERQAELLSQDRVQVVEELVQQRAARIAQARPYVLLELIANHASKIIGADAASIHVYQSDKISLEAGAGKATPGFLRQFLPQMKNIFELAALTDEPVVIDNAEKFVKQYPAIFAEGVRATAAFHLSLDIGLQAILYIHFWREHKFSPAELELEAVFARQMEVVIQNHLLLKNLDDAAEKTRALSQLQNVVQSLASSLDLSRVLNDVALNVLYTLDADNVVLYQYEHEHRRFLPSPVIKGSFYDEAHMHLPISSESVVWSVLRKGESEFIPDVINSPPSLSGKIRAGEKQRFVEREDIVSSAHLVLIDEGTKEIVGLMFVNYRSAHTFDDADEKKMINALASSAAIAIRTARLYERVKTDLQRSDKELQALHLVDEAILASAHSFNPDAVLKLILQKGMEIIGAPVGYVALYNSWEERLDIPILQGVERKLVRWYMGEGIVGQAAEKGQSILTHENEDGWQEMQLIAPETRSALAVPLRDESGLLGVLCVEDPEVDGLDEDDQSFLERISLQVVIAVHSMDLYQKLEKQIRPLRALSVIAPRIQDVHYHLDTILRMLLTGITAGEGAGFSRAMLFLMSEDKTLLEGRMAIGSLTHPEAEQIWAELTYPEKSGMDKDAILARLLDRVEVSSEAIIGEKQNDQPLSLRVQELTFPIDKDNGVLVKCLQDGKVIPVRCNEPNPFRSILETTAQPDEEQSHAFVCIPLIGKGQSAIGVLVVDNRYLPSEREINEDLISILEAFAVMMAMSIENAHLQAQLTEEQRQMTWKELTAKVAHIIGTRITIIHGEVSWLREALEEKPELLSPEMKEYLQGLTNGISKAQVVLREFRQFASPLEMKPQKIDLVKLITTVIPEVLHSVNCRIQPILGKEPVWIDGDRQQLSDAFIELIRNANEAMLTSKTGRSSEVTIAVNRESNSIVCIKFMDTGPGIPDSKKEQVFKPFYSSKGPGSGLGLSIVRNVIEQHQGKIEEVGVDGEGACFVLYLPLTKDIAL